MKINKTNKFAFPYRVVAAVALAALIVLAFVSFVKDNDRRIIEQNNSYIEAAAVQTAERIEDLIELSENSSKMIAELYENVMDAPVVDADLLKKMIDDSDFDYVEFITPDGRDLTADGLTADLSDREYFNRGMNGESGMCVVHNSRITNETLLIFYNPFYFDGEIIGVLSCILRGETLEKALYSEYFGVQGNTYLLERNGGVIISSGAAEKTDNLLEALRNSDKISAEDFEKFEATLDRSNDINVNSFNYKGDSGDGSAYVRIIHNADWALVQSLPSAVTKVMNQSANSAGIKLEIRLLIVFGCYLIYLVVSNMLQRRKLVSEKEVMTNIVEATTQLFARFALVDFESGTYEYIEGKEGSLPQSGYYSDLMKALGERYIDEENSVPMSEIITPEYARKHLTEDVPYLRFEYEIDMNGRKWENLSMICISRKEGVPVSVLYAIQDVTALKKQEHEIRLALKNSSETAEAANRAKSEFLARMSHDIRTPMNAIMGMTAVAAMHLDDRERLTDCLGKITVSSRHLLALINDVLDMSKIESGKVSLSEEPFAMADMVESVVTIIKDQIKSKNQELKVHINGIEHENVIGDVLRLRQIFVNILGNAVKFTPEGGTVIFSISELKSRVHGMACYEFICEDTGIGMDKEFIKTIFDPFSRAKETANIEGTGLGLSITRNIVRMMNGDIGVESEPGKGSKFTVQIHLRLQEQGAEDVGELKDLRVLVADDDQDSCTAACSILDEIGMSADWVLSGEEAVDKTVSAFNGGSGYSAVILDWKMPNMDGIEAARKIRQMVGKELPIIILSAYDWTDVEAEAREAGIQAFIEKPLFRSRLVYALKSVISSDNREKDLLTASLEAANYSGRRALLVEDNELNMEISKELLSITGIDIETAENGKEAVEAVKNNPPKHYDIVFMDIQMPVMNGYEATRAIRDLKREDTDLLPIIAMTANAFSDDVWKAREAGMNDHISKPVEVQKLLDAMKKWL